jgi:hypothetical protein
MEFSLTSRIMLIIRCTSISLGLMGNVISFLVFSRPVFRKNSISTYFRALAIFDCFTISELVSTIYLLSYSLFYPQFSDFACKAYFYIGMAFGSIPGWILIAFSIDKVLNMKRIGRGFIRKRSFQYAVIFIIVLSNLLLYIGIAIYLKLVTIDFYGFPYILCDTSTLSFGAFISTMFMIEGSVLPFIIMLTTSIISIRMVRKSTQNINRERQKDPNRTSRDIKFAFSSIFFNFSFIILKFPVAFLIFLANYIPGLTTAYDLLTIITTIYFLHYSSSFFIHLVSNSLFRRELKKMLRFAVPIGVISWQRTTVTERRSNQLSTANNIESTFE